MSKKTILVIGSGKSNFLRNVAIEAAKRGIHEVCVGHEIDEETMVNRLAMFKPNKTKL